MTVNEDKVNQLVGKFVGDLGATLHAGMAVIGESLGLYKAMRGAGQMSPADLAKKTDTHERYVREWLNSQAAGGYVEYDAASHRYWLTEEQAFVLADETSPAYLPGGFLLAVSATRRASSVRPSARSRA